MPQTPAEFRAAISQHNRNVVLGAFFALLGAAVTWTVVYLLFVGAALGALTLIHGQDFSMGRDALDTPHWVRPAAVGFCGLIMLAGFVDHRARKFRPLNDRLVIGWHLILEVALSPARLTISIFSHLASMITLKPVETYETWRLLWIVYHEQRLSVSAVGLHTAMPQKASKLLSILQLLGLIDLHRKEEDWYYTICSDQEEHIRSMLGVTQTPGERTRSN